MDGSKSALRPEPEGLPHPAVQSPMLDLAPPKAWRRFVPSWLRSVIWVDSAGSYDAFLSYSWKSDSEVAPLIQSVIQRFLCPWYKLRAKTVFRDLSCLPASSSLEAELFDRLDRSTHLIVLASPEAAHSHGMDMEARHWFSRGRDGQVLIVVTAGECKTWEEMRKHLLPVAVRNNLATEPLWVPLQHRRGEILAAPSGHQLRGELIEDLKQILLRFYPGRDWGQLRGEERSQRRRAIALMSGIASLFMVLAVAAVWQWRAATVAERSAVKQAKIAVSRELASHADSLLESDPQLALNLAVRGARRWQTAEAETAVRRALAVVDPGQGEPFKHVGGAGDRFVALSPRSKYGVTQRSDGRLAIWRLLPEPRQVLSNLVLVGSPLFSQDETLFATRTSDGVLTVWSIEDAQRIASFDSVQSATFTSAGLALVRADAAGGGSLMLWDPETRKQTWGTVEVPRGILGAAFIKGAASLYTTVDASHVDVWNVYNPHSSRDVNMNMPQSRYTDSHGITGAWFNGPFVIATNSYESTILNPVYEQLVSHLSLRSLRAVTFSRDGEFMVAVPQSAPPALVHVWTGDILTTLPETSVGVAAVAFSADDQTIIVASPEGVIHNHPCIGCLPFDRLLRTAQGALTRPLTLAERESYLHEQRPHPCPISMMPRAGSCLELAPDSGPPGTVVEVSVRGFVGTIDLSLIDATGTHWRLRSINADPILSQLNPERVGTLTIPGGVPRGPATVSAYGSDSATRNFAVTFPWGEP